MTHDHCAKPPPLRQIFERLGAAISLRQDQINYSFPTIAPYHCAKKCMLAQWSPSAGVQDHPNTGHPAACVASLPTPAPFSLHCIALHGCHEPLCNALHALHATKCNALHATHATKCNAMHCMQRSAMQCIACNACNEVQCNALHATHATKCNALQRSATHATKCNALQRSATHATKCNATNVK